ncbi:PH domain-containing protein, partial [Candidatus Saccharibacteria bacterium]|nr:PH domain-containing protein [Candidatus Saccharibacteria bacterium]
VNIERSLVDRMLNLARISIETAGSTVTQPIQVIGGYTARSEAYLPGLTLEQAKQLHDILIDGKLDEEK